MDPDFSSMLQSSFGGMYTQQTAHPAEMVDDVVMAHEAMITGSLPKPGYYLPANQSGMNDRTGTGMEPNSPARLRGPRWASRATSPTARRAEDVNFGRFTPRRTAAGRDTVEPEYGGFVKNRGLTQLNMMSDIEPANDGFRYQRQQTPAAVRASQRAADAARAAGAVLQPHHNYTAVSTPRTHNNYDPRAVSTPRQQQQLREQQQRELKEQQREHQERGRQHSQHSHHVTHARHQQQHLQQQQQQQHQHQQHHHQQHYQPHLQHQHQPQHQHHPSSSFNSNQHYIGSPPPSVQTPQQPHRRGSDMQGGGGPAYSTHSAHSTPRQGKRLQPPSAKQQPAPLTDREKYALRQEFFKSKRGAGGGALNASAASSSAAHSPPAPRRGLDDGRHPVPNWSPRSSPRMGGTAPHTAHQPSKQASSSTSRSASRRAKVGKGGSAAMQPPLVQLPPTKRITFNARPNVQDMMTGGTANGVANSVAVGGGEPSPGKGAAVGSALSWYATETKDALEAYDRARRGQALPPNHGGGQQQQQQQQQQIAAGSSSSSSSSNNGRAPGISGVDVRVGGVVTAPTEIFASLDSGDGGSHGSHGSGPDEYALPNNLIGDTTGMTNAEISRMNDHIFRVWVGGVGQPSNAPQGHAAEEGGEDDADFSASDTNSHHSHPNHNQQSHHNLNRHRTADGRSVGGRSNGNTDTDGASLERTTHSARSTGDSDASGSSSNGGNSVYIGSGRFRQPGKSAANGAANGGGGGYTVPPSVVPLSPPKQQAKLLGYTPKDNLKRTVDLSKVKSRIDTGRTTKRATKSKIGSGFHKKMGNNVHSSSSSGQQGDHLYGSSVRMERTDGMYGSSNGTYGTYGTGTGTTGTSTSTSTSTKGGRAVPASAGSISRRQRTARLTGQFRDEVTPPNKSAPNSPRRPGKRNSGSRTPNSVRRKLDLAKITTKVDTGRTKRHTPGGGKFNIPLGRMPKSTKGTRM